MQRKHHLFDPEEEVRHYTIGSSAASVRVLDQEARAVEEYEASASESGPGAGETFVRVGIVRMGSEIIPPRFQLLEWARRRVNNAWRFFAEI
jgi:hypothetical protein